MVLWGEVGLGMSQSYYQDESSPDQYVQSMESRRDKKCPPVDTIGYGERGYRILYTLKGCKIDSENNSHYQTPHCLEPAVFDHGYVSPGNGSASR